MSNEVNRSFVGGFIALGSGFVLILLGSGVLVISGAIAGGVLLIKDKWWGGFLPLASGCYLGISLLLDLVHPTSVQFVWLVIVSIAVILGGLIGLSSKIGEQ